MDYLYLLKHRLTGTILGVLSESKTGILKTRIIEADKGYAPLIRIGAVNITNKKLIGVTYDILPKI